MATDEVKGWLFDLAGANYYVDPGKPGQLLKHPVGQQPNPNWSGWEAVRLGTPDSDGRRAVIFEEAKQRLSEDNDGRLTVKGLDWNGDWEMFYIVEEPKDWKIAVVYRRHGDSIKAVNLFRKV